jgi:hypothetical protein
VGHVLNGDDLAVGVLDDGDALVLLDSDSATSSSAHRFLREERGGASILGVIRLAVVESGRNGLMGDATLSHASAGMDGQADAICMKNMHGCDSSPGTRALLRASRRAGSCRLKSG